MITQHTPGPWTVEPPGLTVSATHKNNKQYDIVTCHSAFEPYQCIANARLIAAAPLMYEFVASKANSGDNDALSIMESIHGNAKRN